MRDPAAARMIGALVFSVLLLGVIVEGERASQPVRAAEEVVAMIRDNPDRPITHR